GADRVFGLFMPEADSTDDSLQFGQLLANSLGIKTVLEEITPILKAAGCYHRRDNAIKSVIPEFQEGYKSKIVLPAILEGSRYSVFSVVVQYPAGVQTKERLASVAYLGTLGGTNFQQPSP